MPEVTASDVQVQLDDLTRHIQHRTETLLELARDSLGASGSRAITLVNTARESLEGRRETLENQIRAELFKLGGYFEKELASGADALTLAKEIIGLAYASVSYLVQHHLDDWTGTMDSAVDGAIYTVAAGHQEVLSYVEGTTVLVNNEIGTRVDLIKQSIDDLVAEYLAYIHTEMQGLELQLEAAKSTAETEGRGFLEILWQGISMLGNPLDYLFKGFLDLVENAVDMSPESLQQAADTIMGLTRTVAEQQIAALSTEVED